MTTRILFYNSDNYLYTKNLWSGQTLRADKYFWRIRTLSDGCQMVGRIPENQS